MSQVLVGLRGVALVLVVVGAFPNRQAVAEDADTLIKHGIELRKQGRDREALAEFERAFAIKETPRALAQIGLAEHALGLWVSAEKHLGGALKQSDDAWIKRNGAVLNEALTVVSSHLGSIEVWGSPAGADLFLNGEPAGQLPPPTPLRAVAGSCSLVARAEGYEEFSRNLRVVAGKLVRENVQLVRLAGTRPNLAAIAPKVSAATGDQSPTVVTASAVAGDTPTPTTDGGITRKWWFWTAIGVVVVGGVLGGVALARSDGGGISCPRGVECPP